MKQICCLCFAVAMLASCKKDEHKVYLEGGTAPVLTASVTSPNLPLSFANKDKEALRLTWTNPNYQFTTGTSSQNVNYEIEIDTAGLDFKGAKRQTIAINKELSKTFNVSEFNGFLLNQLQFDTAATHHIEIRVKSSLVNQSAVMYSNVLKYTVVPYAIPPVVPAPADKVLYIVGDATPKGWDNPVPDAQKFTTIDALHYVITLPLIGGKEYLFLPKNGDWGHKYACKKKADQGTSGGDFGYDFADNFPGPAASGNYKIEVDFQRGKYTVTKMP